MEPISLNARVADFTRQWNQLRQRALRSMKTGIETRNLRYSGQSVTNRFNRRQVMRLMQWGQLLQAMQISQHLRCHDGRAGVLATAMHHPVSNTRDPGPPVCGPEPPSDGVKCPALVTHIGSEVLIQDNMTLIVAGRDARCGTDAFDLAATRDLPVTVVRLRESRELQT